MKQNPLAAVIGHPIAHSLSPLIFSVLARREKRLIDYTKIDVPPKDLAPFMKVSRQLEIFTGWNVTIPHKQSVAKACSRLSPEARAAGAVNVVHFAGQAMRGFNTDILGVERTLADHGIRVRGMRAVVFGAGGAGLAAGYALARQGAREVIFVNRTRARGRTAAARLTKSLKSSTRFRAVAWPGDFGEEIDLYVNATSLGLGGGADQPPLPRGARKGAVAFDVVYVPERTAFLRAAEKRGLRAIGGLDMLIWQAIATWEIWFGELSSVRRSSHKIALERALRAELARRKKTA